MPNKDTAAPPRSAGVVGMLRKAFDDLYKQVFDTYDGDFARYKVAIRELRRVASVLDRPESTPVPLNSVTGRILAAYHRAHPKVYKPSKLWVPATYVSPANFKFFNDVVTIGWRKLSREEQIQIVSMANPLKYKAPADWDADKRDVLYLLQAYHESVLDAARHPMEVR